MKTLIERIKKPKLILLSGYRMFRLMKASAFSLSIEIALENINVDTFCSVIYHILKDIMTSCRENHSSNVFFISSKYMMLRTLLALRKRLQW